MVKVNLALGIFTALFIAQWRARFHCANPCIHRRWKFLVEQQTAQSWMAAPFSTFWRKAVCDANATSLRCERSASVSDNDKYMVYFS
jgi:hypothetical protein